MIRVLLLLGHQLYPADGHGRILADYLRASDGLELEVGDNRLSTNGLERFDAVVQYGLIGWPAGELEASLCDFVRHGGGLVAIHPEPDPSDSDSAYLDLLGGRPNGRGPVAELKVSLSQSEHYVTRRLDKLFLTRDEFASLDGPFDGAEVLLSTTWRFKEYPLAWTREFGAGRVFCTTLGHTEQTIRHQTFQRVIQRAIRHVAGVKESAALGVGIVGYGPAGGMGYAHGAAVESVSGLRLVAVCDRATPRHEQAKSDFPEVRTYRRADALAADSNVGLAIIATPPSSHARLAELMLRSGKHVVCEKPFCLTADEADRLIALADERGLVLTVYQNRRWDRDFRAVQRAVREGLIGDVFYLESFIGGFEHPCSLWHSHAPISGGVAYDWGSHYVDWILNLLPGQVATVKAAEHKRVWHDVTNADQITIQLRFDDGREAVFLESSIAAIRKPKWYLLGTRGALVADWREVTLRSRDSFGDLVEDRPAVADSPADLTATVYDGAGGLIEQRLPLAPSAPNAFHRNLADHLLQGEPLAVTSRSARRVIAILEAAQRSAETGARQIEVDC